MPPRLRMPRRIAMLFGPGAPVDGEAGVHSVLRSGFFLPPPMFDADDTAIRARLNGRIDEPRGVAFGVLDDALPHHRIRLSRDDARGRLTRAFVSRPAAPVG